MTKKTIGIVGGGQLGRMLTEAAHGLGFKVVVLDPTPNSPAGQVADKQILGSFKDKNKILELAKLSDFITFEIELANEEALEKIAKKKQLVNPNPKILKIIKDKLRQKKFLKSHRIPVAKFTQIKKTDNSIKISRFFGYPFLLKARFDAYDGRGNYVVKNKKDMSTGLKKLAGNLLYAEKFVHFKKELSVVSARDRFGTLISYPVVETTHKNNICHIVRSPANVTEAVKRRAENLAKKTLKSLGGVGVFAVEMFLSKNGQILVNEVAPRVHNSGHHTIEAFSTSQFEQHIRAITGQKILPLKAVSKAAVMINILGERNGKASLKGIKKLSYIPHAKIHIYGKMETRPERKMGHITVLGENLRKVESMAKKAHKHISI